MTCEEPKSYHAAASGFVIILFLMGHNKEIKEKRPAIFSTPLLLAGLGVLAFGIQAFWLGYYLDDWVVLYHIFRGGYERLAAYSFIVNRPYGAWPWWLGFRLLGYSPLGWQAWSIFWRWLTCVLLWLAFTRVWPGKKLQISMASALFLVYPIFLQQADGVTFSDHWLCFALYAASLLCTVLAVQRHRFYLPLTGLALLFSGLELFTLEYFVGLELLRFPIIWLLLRDVSPPKKRFRGALLHSLPYALLLGGFLVWRFAFMPTPGADRNTPEILTGLLQDPLHTLPYAVGRDLQDVVEALLGTWYKTYQPSSISALPPSNLAAWGIGLLAFLIASLFFLRQSRAEPQAPPDARESWSWIGFGFLVMVAGFLPAWAIDQHLVTTENYADRYGLAAMFGAALVLVGLAGFFLRRRHHVLLICVLIGLGAGFHFRLESGFRHSWERQTRLAWQLHWRMPGLQPHTALYGDGVLATGSWVDTAWINFLYGRPSPSAGEDYWYFNVNEDQVPKPGQPLSKSRFEHLSYQGNSSDALVIQFKTVDRQCLWVLDASDSGNPYLNPGLERALPLSSLERILPAGTGSALPLQTVFSPEPAHDWCYYFEKADLAVQQKQWAAVQQLWRDVEAKKLDPAVPAEYLPFIHGTASAGDLQTALAISRRAKKLDHKMQAPLCQAWQQIVQDQPAGADTAALQQEIRSQLDCG
jgi:hypothetical protein